MRTELTVARYVRAQSYAPLRYLPFDSSGWHRFIHGGPARLANLGIMFVREGDLLVCIYFLSFLTCTGLLVCISFLFRVVCITLRRYGVPCTPILHAVPGAY